MVLFGILGFTIAMEAINLNISTLVGAIALLTLALTMALTGLFGRLLSSFVFLLVSHPYYKGDTCVLLGEVTNVRKITLLNTYGYTTDNKWVMYDNAGIAASRVLNLSRSNDCVFVYETPIHADTPKKAIDIWERTIRSYIQAHPESWRDFTFTISSVNPDNKFTIEMKAFVRGANWAHSEAYNPLRAELWKVVHQSAVQLGIFGAPKDPETELVDLVTADRKSEERLVERDEGSEGEGKKEKKKEKSKKSDSKKEK